MTEDGIDPVAEHSRRVRIVAVDDHPTYVRGLKVLLETLAEDIEVAGIATSPQEGLDQVAEHRPDIVLMDVRMPGSEGCETARKIRQLFPEVKVVMLTVSDDPRDVYDTMEAGVRGYLSKLAEPEELIAALRSVHAGEVVLAPFAARLSFEDASRRLIPLTDAELHTLKLSARGLENAQIAKELAVSESTLKRMFREIQRKLGVDNRIQAVVVAAKKGLV
jgi:DNA-binding NarL/FixJ family response regulator